MGLVVRGREAFELLLSGRNVLEHTRLTPGVTQGIRGGFATGISGNAETYRARNLNRASFVKAPGSRFGNLGRNSLGGPSTQSVNLGITKNIKINERFKAQFRTEVFNLFNTPQLTPPNTDLNNTSTFNGFGTIRSTYGFTNRQIQIGARIEF